MSNPKRRFGGLIVVQPPEHLSYDPALLRTPEVLTREQQLELTRAQAWRLVQKLVGKPMRSEHSRVKVGEVVNAYIDDQGNACVRFELDDTEEGRRQARMIDAGYTRELSLAHYLGTDEALEVSICFEGAREGTVITEGWEQNNSSEYKPPADAVSQVPTQSVLIQASASMDQQGQVALPPANATAPPQPVSFQAAAPGIELLHPSQLGQPAPGQAPANPHKITSITGGPPKRRRVVTGPDGQTMEVEDPEQPTAPPAPSGASPFAAAGPPPVPIQATGQQQQMMQQQMPPQQQQQQMQQMPQQQQMPPQQMPQQQQMPPQQQQPPQMQQQQGTAPAEPPKLTDEQQLQLLSTLARKHGQLSLDEQEKLIHTMAQYRKEATELKNALQRSTQTLQQQPGNQQARSEIETQRMRQEHLLSMMGPFLRTFSGEDMTDKDLADLLDRFRKRPEEAEQYLLRASANAVGMAERLRLQSAVDPRIQRALNVFQEATTTGSFPSQSLGWAPDPATASHLQQQQPMYAPPQQYQQPQYMPPQPQYQQPQYAPQPQQYQQPQYAPQLVNASHNQPQYQPQPQYMPQQQQYMPPQQQPQLQPFTLYGPRPPLPVLASAGGGADSVMHALKSKVPDVPMSLYAPSTAPAASGAPEPDPLAILVQASRMAHRYPTPEEAKEAHFRYLTQMANSMPTPSDLVDRDRSLMIKRAEALPGPDELRQSQRQFALPSNVFQN